MNINKKGLISKVIVLAIAVALLVQRPGTAIFAKTVTINNVTVNEAENANLSALAAAEMAQFPISVQKSFVDNGWNYYIVENQGISKAFGQKKKGWIIDAYTDINGKAIYINGSKRNIKSLYHEMGHFIDSTQGWPSQTAEFAAIYASEAARVSEYATSNAKECFAEVVMGYYTDPEGTKKKAPQAYAFVTNVIMNYK